MKPGDIYRYGGLLYGVNLLTSFVTFMVTILLARAITKEELGMYGLFQAYFVLAGAITSFGLSQSIVKFVAERSVDVREIHTLVGAVVGVMAVVLTLAGAALLHFGHDVLGLAVMTLPAYHLFDFALSYARAHLWKRAESAIILGSSLGTSVFIVALLPVFPDHRAPIYGQMLSAYTTAGVLLAVFLFVRRGEARFMPIHGGWLKDFALVAYPIFITAILYTVSGVADRFIVEQHLGLLVLGEYFLAMTLFNILDKPVALLSRVLLSHLCGPGAQLDPQRHIESVRTVMRLNVVLLPVFSLLVVGILPVVLVYFFNKDYSNTFDILAIVSVIMAVKAFEVVNSMLAIAKNNAKTNVHSQFLSLLIYLPMALVFVRFFGIAGVAVAIVVRWVVSSVFQAVRLRRNGVDTVPPLFMLRAVAAYIAALAFFADAPWAMVPVYLLAGTTLRLWRLEEVSRSFTAWRVARAPGK